LQVELLVGGDADAQYLVTDFFHRFLSFCFGVIASASLKRLAETSDDARPLQHFLPGRRNFFLTISLDLSESNTRLNLENRWECNTIQNPTRCNIMTKVEWENVIQPGKGQCNTIHYKYIA
jgi:hypothetical protein